MRAATLSLLVLLVTGCAEVRQPPPPPPPVALAGGAADPIRASIDAIAPAFADQARGLARRPAEAAQAAAQLEYVTAAIPRVRTYAAFSEQTWRELVLARQELRDALGVADDAPGERVATALLAAATALRAGDAARAAAALPAPMFRPGGARSVARLGELGPLPQGAIATALARQELARLDATGGWPGGQPGERTNWGAGGGFGLSADTTIGY
ncbi:hypothetical protein [Roseicella aquatilis]|uniref:hypothetical protein n=1 Tax=Roseicella aquatilis TaxID=2527868 RepID=UPI0014049636|nr:hypothetical protein [Roseicella aquatilis]